MATSRERLPVRRPFERILRDVRNQSERTASIQLIVLHDTESHDRLGNADLEAIGAWFDNPASQASAHVCVDEEGRSARYVTDDRKAWHCAAYNSASLGIEQIGFATYTRTLWNRQARAQLKTVAKYIAYWSKTHGIPIQAGAVKDGRVVRPGIVTHAQLGQAGGGHHDPGTGYPLAAVLYTARYYARRGWPR